MLLSISKCEILMDGIVSNSAETAYQYKKAKICGAMDKGKRQELIDSAFEAKDIGGRIVSTPDWVKSQEETMHTNLKIKFSHNVQNKRALLETGKATLEEFTGDRKCVCVGGWVWGGGGVAYP